MRYSKFPSLCVSLWLLFSIVLPMRNENQCPLPAADLPASWSLRRGPVPCAMAVWWNAYSAGLVQIGIAAGGSATCSEKDVSVAIFPLFFWTDPVSCLYLLPLERRRTSNGSPWKLAGLTADLRLGAWPASDNGQVIDLDAGLTRGRGWVASAAHSSYSTHDTCSTKCSSGCCLPTPLWCERWWRPSRNQGVNHVHEHAHTIRKQQWDNNGLGSALADLQCTWDSNEVSCS